MIIRPKHVLLVLRRFSCNMLRESLAIVRPLLVLHKAKFHMSVPAARSIFHNHEPDLVDTEVPDIGQPMEAWYYDVNRHGRLVVRSAMDVHIQPLDPQKHPMMNKLFINILYMGKDKLSSSELTELAKQYIVNVDLDDRNEEMEISIKHKPVIPVPALCHLQVPLKYGVDVSCSKGGEASLANLEGENVRVRTHRGNCTLRSIKAISVNIQTRDGNVVSPELIQGNTNIACGGYGSINVGRLQGEEVHCESHHGDINVKAIYANNASFTTNGGNIQLGSCHGNTDIKLNVGDLTVDTLDGTLNAMIASGNAKISLSREGNINLEAERGDIALRVPKCVDCSVELTANHVDLGEVSVHNSETSEDKNLIQISGQLSEEPMKGIIQARTNKGKIQLGYYDWLSSLNLGKI